MPEKYRKSVIVSVYKKGDKAGCSNF